MRDKKSCDPYCICPNCGAGPTSVKKEFRHIYWPEKFDKKGDEINGRK